MDQSVMFLEVLDSFGHVFVMHGLREDEDFFGEVFLFGNDVFHIGVLG
jgi:hypothetical protein